LITYLILVSLFNKVITHYLLIIVASHKALIKAVVSPNILFFLHYRTDYHIQMRILFLCGEDKDDDYCKKFNVKMTQN